MASQFFSTLMQSSIHEPGHQAAALSSMYSLFQAARGQERGVVAYLQFAFTSYKY